VYLVRSGDAWDLRSARIDGSDGPDGVLVVPAIGPSQSGEPLLSPDGRWAVWHPQYAPTDGSWAGRRHTIEVPDADWSFAVRFLDADTVCLTGSSAACSEACSADAVQRGS